MNKNGFTRYNAWQLIEQPILNDHPAPAPFDRVSCDVCIGKRPRRLRALVAAGGFVSHAAIAAAIVAE